MSDVVGITQKGEQALAASLAPMAVLEGERHVTVNRQYADLFGFEGPAAIEGTAWRERFDEQTRTRIEREITPTCRETGRWRGEVTGRRRDGSSLALELSIVQIDGVQYASCLRRFESRHHDPDGAYRGSIGVVRDVTEREEGERRLERRRDDRVTLDRITKLVLEITRDVFDSASRRGIEENVCEVLASSDLYRFAWIGGLEPGGDRLVPRVVAGIDEADVESTRAAPGGDAEPGPVARAFRTGEAAVSQDVPKDPVFEAWRHAAADHDARSTAVVPILSGDTTYGCIAVAASRPLAFSRREREAIETLGRAVGFAFDAIENRKLLYADTVVELEFEVSDHDLVFVAASDRLDCELTITGCVESQDGAWSVYVSVTDAAPAAVRDAALDDPGVGSVRVIAESDDGALLEFVMAGPALDEITASGAILTSGRAAHGQARFRFEVPQTTDVRRLRDRLLAAYPDSTLVAQREHERPARTAMEIRQSLDERLTDRQRETLQRATHAGYFDWPRTSTAGDVAEAMAISETTFHYHLRNGLDTLLGTLMDLDGR